VWARSLWLWQPASRSSETWHLHCSEVDPSFGLLGTFCPCGSNRGLFWTLTNQEGCVSAREMGKGRQQGL
jgi:hypothetical protein